MKMTYEAAEDHYNHEGYRRCGRGGLRLPPLSRGHWQNFGDERPLGATGRPRQASTVGRA